MSGPLEWTTSDWEIFRVVLRTFHRFNFEKHHQARLLRLKNHGYESGSFSLAFRGWASVAGFSQWRKTLTILDFLFLKVCKSVVRVIVAFNASLRIA